jgi:hypothetical protein
MFEQDLSIIDRYWIPDPRFWMLDTDYPLLHPWRKARINQADKSPVDNEDLVWVCHYFEPIQSKHLLLYFLHWQRQECGFLFSRDFRSRLSGLIQLDPAIPAF